MNDDPKRRVVGLLAQAARAATQEVTVTKSGGAQQSSTPRLREYFPETLVWQPALETDKQGRAQLKFKLADNITTWKMSVIGSTEDGQIGTVEKEIKAFQPFFVEPREHEIINGISAPGGTADFRQFRPNGLDVRPVPVDGCSGGLRPAASGRRSDGRALVNPSASQRNLFGIERLAAERHGWLVKPS